MIALSGRAGGGGAEMKKPAFFRAGFLLWCVGTNPRNCEIGGHRNFNSRDHV